MPIHVLLSVIQGELDCHQKRRNAYRRIIALAFFCSFGSEVDPPAFLNFLVMSFGEFRCLSDPT